MKNYLKMAFIAVMTIPMLFSLSSCDKDDKDDKEVTYRGILNLTYDVYDELLSVADIEISYYDENGELRKEPVTNAKWKKRITYNKLPAKSGFKITLTKKNQLPDGKTSFKLGYRYDGTIYLVKGEYDEVVTDVNPNVGMFSDVVKIADLDEYLESYGAEEFYQITDKEIIKTSK